MEACPTCGRTWELAQPAFWCPYCGAPVARVPPPVVRPFPAYPAYPHYGDFLQETAGVVSILAGFLLLAAVPLTMILLQEVSGRSIGYVFYALAPSLLCGGGIHVALALAAFWGGYWGIKFRLERWTGFLGAGIASIFAALFLLGGILGFIAGVLLITAAILVFLS